MRTLVILCVIVACVVHHHVRLLIGPTETTISTGFQCRDPQNPAQVLFARALTPQNTLSFNVVVDLLDLDDHITGCLGEEIVASCAASECKISVADAPTRFCEHLDIPITPGTVTPEMITGYIHEHLPTVIHDAPDHAVLVRAVATLQPCAEIQVNDGTQWTRLKSDDTTNVVLGCAYSCPVLLDNVDVVSLGIDVGLRALTTAECNAAIKACALFP